MQDNKMNQQDVLSEIVSPIFSAAWRDLTDGATVEYDGNAYTIGTDAFGSFAAAKAAGYADAISLDVYVNTDWAASGTESAQGYEVTLGVDGFNNLADAQKAFDGETNKVIHVVGGTFPTTGSGTNVTAFNGYATVVEDTLIGSFFGGKTAQGATVATTDVTLRAATVTDFAVGGGRYAEVTEGTYLTVVSSTLAKIYGGAFSYSACATVEVRNSVVGWIVSSQTTVGDFNLSISGSTVTRVGAAGSQNNSYVNGNSTITVSNSEITSLFGNRGNDGSANPKDCYVKGDAVVHIASGTTTVSDFRFYAGQSDSASLILDVGATLVVTKNYAGGDAVITIDASTCPGTEKEYLVMSLGAGATGSISNTITVVNGLDGYEWKLAGKNLYYAANSVYFSVLWQGHEIGDKIEYQGKTLIFGTDAFGNYADASEKSRNVVSADVYVDSSWKQSSEIIVDGYTATFGVDAFSDFSAAVSGAQKLNGAILVEKGAFESFKEWKAIPVFVKNANVSGESRSGTTVGENETVEVFFSSSRISTLMAGGMDGVHNMDNFKGNLHFSLDGSTATRIGLAYRNLGSDIAGNTAYNMRDIVFSLKDSTAEMLGNNIGKVKEGSNVWTAATGFTVELDGSTVTDKISGGRINLAVTGGTADIGGQKIIVSGEVRNVGGTRTIDENGVVTFTGGTTLLNGEYTAAAVTVYNGTYQRKTVKVAGGTSYVNEITEMEDICITLGATLCVQTISPEIKTITIDATECDFSQDKYVVMISPQADSLAFDVKGGREGYAVKNSYIDSERYAIYWQPVGIVTEDGTADEVVVGGTTYKGRAYGKDELSQALRDKDIIVARNVSYQEVSFHISGKRSFITEEISISGGTAEYGGAIYSSGTATISGSTFTGNAAGTNGGAIYNNGTATIRDSVFVTETDTVYNTGNLTLGGTIMTAAQIYSSKAIAFENGTKLVLDISGYTTGNTAALLSNYNTAFADNANFSVTVNVSAERTFGSYLVADNASSFNKSITVSNGSWTSDAFGIGQSAAFGDAKYSLLRDGANIILKITAPVGIVTTGGTATEVTVGGKVYTGKAFAADQITTALAAADTVVAQDVTLSGFTVSEKKEFIGDKIEISGNTAGDYDDYGFGGVVYNAGTTTISAGTFTENMIEGWGVGAIYNNFDSIATISDSTFTDNSSAICNYGTTTIANSIFTGNDTAIYSYSFLTLTGSTFTDNARALETEGSDIFAANCVFFNNTSGLGGVLFDNGGNWTFKDSVFSGNTSSEDGVFCNWQGFVIITDSIFTDNSGGAIFNTGYGIISITGSTFTGNTEKNNGGAIYNGNSWIVESPATVTITECVFSGNTADLGGAIYNWEEDEGSDPVAAAITIRDSIFATASDTIYNEGGTLTLGGTITTAAQIYSSDAIVFENGTKLVLDLSAYASADGMESLLANYNTAFGNNANFSITVDVSPDQAYGTYVLATEASKFDRNKTVSIVSKGSEIGALQLNGAYACLADGKCYMLKLANGVLSLRVDVPRQVQAAIVTSSGETSVFIGDTIYYGNSVAPGNIQAALNTYSVVAAQKVSYANKKLSISINHTFVADAVSMSGSSIGAIANSGTAAVSGSTFSGNAGGAIYSNGTATIRDSVFATATDTIYNEGGTLTFDGTIRTAANIASTNAIAVNENTAIVLDLSVYAGTTTKELLTDYNTMFGTSQDNLNITINVAQDQAAGVYTLATHASNFDMSKTISVVCNGNEIGSVGRGNSFVAGDKEYSLQLDDEILSLHVKALQVVECDAIITTYGGTSVIVGGTIYYGNAVAPEDTQSAIYYCWDPYHVVVQDVSYTTKLEVGITEFIADAIEMSGIEATNDYGGALKVSHSDCYGGLVIVDSTFAYDTAGNGGVIANCGTDVGANTSVENSTFAYNHSYGSGGAIYNGKDNEWWDYWEHSCNYDLILHGNRFTGNVAEDSGGAIYNVSKEIDSYDLDDHYQWTDFYFAVATIKDTIFTGNSAKQGGAIFNGGTMSITGCTFTDNTADKGGAVFDFDRTESFRYPWGYKGGMSQGGPLTIRDCVFATPSDTVYSTGRDLTIGGTIRTGANITSTKAITVEIDTKLILDISVRTADMGELLTNYDTMFGSSQSNLSITVHAAQAQSTGVYILATKASSFNRQITFDAGNESVMPLDFVTKVVFGERAYRLARNDQDLQLVVEIFSEKKIFGGGTVSFDTVISETTPVYIAGGSFVAAAGGVYATNCRVDVNTDTNVSVGDAYFSNIVCAGSIVNENTVLTVNGASRLTITGGTFANAVAGGNYIQKEGGTVYGGRGAKASNTFVNITGGTFQRDVFGGNIAAKNSFVTTTNSYVTGSTNITIDTNENVVSIGGNLVAGSSGLGAIIGSTNLTFKGNAEKLLFGSKSIVCGDSHDATTAVSCVKRDSRFLTFDDFTGTLNAKVVGFDQMTFTGGSVTLSKSSRLSDISVWNFSDGAMLVFDDVVNNFQNDTLSFGTFEGNEWTVVSGADSTLANWDWADQVTIAGQNASFDETLGYWTSADYKFYKEDNALIVAKKGQIA